MIKGINRASIPHHCSHMQEVLVLFRRKREVLFVCQVPAGQCANVEMVKKWSSFCRAWTKIEPPMADGDVTQGTKKSLSCTSILWSILRDFFVGWLWLLGGIGDSGALPPLLCHGRSHDGESLPLQA